MAIWKNILHATWLKFIKLQADATIDYRWDDCNASVLLFAWQLQERRLDVNGIYERYICPFNEYQTTSLSVRGSILKIDAIISDKMISIKDTAT